METLKELNKKLEMKELVVKSLLELQKKGANNSKQIHDIGNQVMGIKFKIMQIKQER